MLVVGSDLEWDKHGIDVLGLALDEGRVCTATARDEQSLGEYISVLNRADVVVGHSFIDADCRQLSDEGIDISGFERKVFDTRLAMHATHGHLAGTGSFDLRSTVLLLNGRQGFRFPLDWKKYESDLHRTCAMDAAASLWTHSTLDRQVRTGRLEKTLQISHECAPVFARMRKQGVRLDPQVLAEIYNARKKKTQETIERYGLWEERGKKKVKRVPIWRSDKLLDKFEAAFGIRVKDRQRKTWEKLSKTPLIPEAREFVDAVLDLGKGANDAHWLGEAEETEDGIDFSKVSAEGLIHPRYDICGSPDRCIASGPNIQNFPRVSDDPRPTPLRAAVVGLRPDDLIVGIDFSSVETITNAIESDDWDRAEATLQGKITHEGTAEMVNKALRLNLTRQQGKAINHGVDKGESPFNLARTLFKGERPSRQQVLDCEKIVTEMLRQYPKTAKFRDDLWERAIENPLVVQNRFGRKLMCFSRAKYGDAAERFAKHDARKKYWCSCSACGPRRDRWKYAIAFLGRSAAFDALLRKMSAVWYGKVLDEYSLPYMEVHDELDFSVPRDRAEMYAERLKLVFETYVDELGVKLPAEYGIGDSWAKAH